MAEQQPQSSSSGTSGTGGRPSNRAPSTAGDKGGGGASAAKKARNKRNNDRKKKNNQQKKGAAQKATFVGGVTDTTSPLFGRVIDPSSATNMVNQCRRFIIQLKQHCTNKQMYKLNTSIDTGIILVRDDFLFPMPDSSSYANRVTDPDTGNVSLVITNPEKKEELNIVWNKTLNSEIAEWTKYESFYKSLFSTVIGQLHDKVLSTCKLDKVRWNAIEQNLDLVALLNMIEKVCNQNSAGNRVFMPANNLITIEKCLSYKQRDSVSNTEFAKEVNTMYKSVIHQNGEFAFGTSYYDSVMAKRSGDFASYYALSSTNKIPIDKEVQELIVSMLVMKGCNHNRARNELSTQYSFGTITDATYPATEEAVITLLDSVKRGNDNSNNKAAAAAGGEDDAAIVAAHEIEYISDGDGYSDEESAYEEESVESTEEADEATLMASSVEGEANADTKTGEDGSFMATILANAAATYDEEIESIENSFINRIDKQQDIEDAFDDNEPEVIVAVHSAELVDEDDNGDFVIIAGGNVSNINHSVDNSNTMQLLDSSASEEENDANGNDGDADFNGNIMNNNDINNNGMNVNNNNTIELLNATSSDEDSNNGLEINNDNNVQAAADTGASNNGVNLLLIQPTESQKHDALKVTRDTVTAVFAASTTIINRKFASKAQAPTINHIIDYADALLCKFRNISITTATELHNAVKDDHVIINTKLHASGHPKLHTSTIDELRKESWRASSCTEAQSARYYNNTILTIGQDDSADPMDLFGIRDIIQATAEMQMRHAPIRWTNKVTAKLIASGIKSPQALDDAVANGTLNTIIEKSRFPALHKISIHGIRKVLDFHQGRS
jgi:NurA-like 5'-3' nuclease